MVPEVQDTLESRGDHTPPKENRKIYQDRSPSGPSEGLFSVTGRVGLGFAREGFRFVHLVVSVKEPIKDPVPSTGKKETYR